MKNIPPSAIGDYVDTFLSRNPDLQLGAQSHFRGTITNVQALLGPYGPPFSCQIDKTEDRDDGDYICAVPGYLPIVGDVVECERRNDNLSGYIKYPIQLANGRTTPNQIDSQSPVLVGSLIIPTVDILPTWIRHCSIKLKLRGSTNAANVGLSLRVNGDSGNNYSIQTIAFNNATSLSAGIDVANAVSLGNIPANTAPANSFGVYYIDLFDINSLTDQTVIRWTGFQRSGTGVGGMVTHASSGIYLLTDPISTIQILWASGTVSGLVETYSYL